MGASLPSPPDECASMAKLLEGTSITLAAFRRRRRHARFRSRWSAPPSGERWWRRRAARCEVRRQLGPHSRWPRSWAGQSAKRPAHCPHRITERTVSTRARLRKRATNLATATRGWHPLPRRPLADRRVWGLAQTLFLFALCQEGSPTRTHSAHLWVRIPRIATSVCRVSRAAASTRGKSDPCRSGRRGTSRWALRFARATLEVVARTEALGSSGT